MIAPVERGTRATSGAEREGEAREGDEHVISPVFVEVGPARVCARPSVQRRDAVREADSRTVSSAFQTAGRARSILRCCTPTHAHRHPHTCPLTHAEARPARVPDAHGCRCSLHAAETATLGQRDAMGRATSCRSSGRRASRVEGIQ